MKKILCSLIPIFLCGHVLAKEVVFECHGARVKMDILENKLEWVNANPKSQNIGCTFWRDRMIPEYSKDVPFGGSLSISSDKNGFLKNAKSQKELNGKLGKTIPDHQNGTWSKVKRQEIVFEKQTSDKHIQIFVWHSRSMYLATVAKDEEEEVIRDTVDLSGLLWQKGVYVRFAMSLPYKSLTESEVVQMMKSVEVMQGFAN